MNPPASPQRFSPWQGLSEHIPVGIYVLLTQPDGQLRWLFASRRWLAMVNAELEALQADPDLAFQAVHPQDRESFQQLSAARVAACEPLHWQGRLLVAGKVSWVRIDSMPIPQADGCLLWEGVMIDISDLKQREMELQQRQQELHLTLDNLQIPLGSSRIDGDQSIVFFNRCFSETFGYDFGTVPNVASWMQQAYPFPLRRRFYEARWQRDVESARGGDGRIPAREYRVTCRDGSRRHVLLSGVVLDDLLVAAFLDITERRRAELELALARRRQRGQRQQQLAELERKLQSSLSAAAMVHEIQQLRNVQTPHRPVNLSEVVESALLFLRRTLLDAGIVVETQATNAFCWVAGDGAQLQIAVANLLRNALEALLSAATVEPRIAVTLRRDGGALELEVADNGPGLPPCLLDDNPVVSSGAKGMGVGLSVVQITRENHGGTLRQGRSPQGGATAILRLPALSTPPSGLSYL